MPDHAIGRWPHVANHKSRVPNPWNFSFFGKPGRIVCACPSGTRRYAELARDVGGVTPNRVFAHEKRFSDHRIVETLRDARSRASKLEPPHFLVASARTRMRGEQQALRLSRGNRLVEWVQCAMVETMVVRYSAYIVLTSCE